MSINKFTPVACGQDCATLPTFTAGVCSPKKTNSEISMILFSRVGFTNDPKVGGSSFNTEYTTRLSNTSTDANAIRFKECFAELPDADPDTVTDEYGTIIPKWANRQITFVDSDMSDENYGWHEKAQCMGECKFWYVIDGYIYGGKSGIKAVFYSTQSSTQSGDAVSNKFNCKAAFRMIGIIPRGLLPV